MRKILVIISFVVLPWAMVAQLETTADWKRQVYDKEFTGGIVFHTRGYGVNFRSLKYQDGFNKTGLEFDFTFIRHPKEIKQPSQVVNSSRGYVYGKINSLHTLRVGYGFDKILIDKTDQGSVAIGWVTFFGGSFGLLKPVYLEVVKTSPQGINYSSIERYDPEVHDFRTIVGQAPFFKGIENTSLRMGLYAKSGFAFDYNWNDDKVSSLELGVVVDFFPGWAGIYPDTVPILIDTTNYSLWLQFYFSLNFGKKWN